MFGTGLIVDDIKQINAFSLSNHLRTLICSLLQSYLEEGKNFSTT